MSLFKIIDCRLRVFSKVHHIVDVGIAAHGIFFGKRIIMQPGQVSKFQAAGFSPIFKFRRFDEFAIACFLFVQKLYIDRISAIFKARIAQGHVILELSPGWYGISCCQ